MKDWILVLNVAEERKVIKPAEDFDSTTELWLQTVAAEDWCRAKAALGYELTPLQEELVPLDQAGRECVVQGEKWFNTCGGLGSKPTARPRDPALKGWRVGH